MEKLTPSKNNIQLSPPTLHPPVITKEEHKTYVKEQLAQCCHQHEQNYKQADAETTSVMTDPSFELYLTTVSLNTNYDSHLYISFDGASGNYTSLIFDTGNTVLIVPYYDHIPDVSSYEVLAEHAVEPFGCPAKILRGPINIRTTGNSQQNYTLENVIFYACTGTNDPDYPNYRTANFGAGCVTNWRTPAEINEPMQSPLTYNPDYPYAEIKNGVPPDSGSGSPLVNSNSSLVLYRSDSLPSQYIMMDIIPNQNWMSVEVQNIWIASQTTNWPGKQTAIAFVDTGGGAPFLSDPNQYIVGQNWPGETNQCPFWTNINEGPLQSTNCKCVDSDITITLTDGRASLSYEIEVSALPSLATTNPGQPSEVFVSLVPCQKNGYMMNQYGMNIGGLSCLFLTVLVDYFNKKVGFNLAYWY